MYTTEQRDRLLALGEASAAFGVPNQITQFELELYYHFEEAKLQLAAKTGHKTEDWERLIIAPDSFHSDIEEFLPRAEARFKAINSWPIQRDQ